VNVPLVEVELGEIVSTADPVAPVAPVAVTVTVWVAASEAGAVYKPPVEIEPTAGFSDHVTAVLVVPVTVAPSCWVWPAVTPAVAGETATVTGSSVTVDEAEVPLVEVAVTVTVWVAETEAGAV